ncbi:MAG TPA: peptidoglycan-binding domain-containing protein [Candidatus Udaeobacter sp.]|nr:peptidoglycan-binding domain-containing protein [Candidatus Udaeobacter sp.]
MKTKRMLFLICVATLGVTASVAAATHVAPMTRPAMTRPAPHFAPRTTTGTHRFFNNRDHHIRRFHNRTFIFVDTFGFPFFYPYPYYGYYPYGYYGYNDYGYGDAAYTVVEVQRRLARAGYYHGPIDGILGPQTRRAIRAYERDHSRPA